MFDFIANSSVGDYTGGKFGEGASRLQIFNDFFGLST